MNSKTIVNFLNFKKDLELFITKEAEIFKFRFLMESIHNESFMTEVLEIIQYVSQDLTSEQIEVLFTSLRNKSIEANKHALGESDPEKRMEFHLLNLAYFSLLETLNENSSFSLRIEAEIHTEFGEDTLKVLSIVDRSSLSVDGRKYISSEWSDISEGEVLKKYKLMKRWQDKQRLFSLENIRTIYPIEKEYIGYEIENLMDLQRTTLILRAKRELINMDIIPIDIISKYIISGLRTQLIEIVGGKAYGLAILNSNSINIPETYIISGSKNDFNTDTLKFLDHDSHYAVRSSADVEDGIKYSFAGVFQSFLDVPYTDLLTKILLVKESVSTKKATSYLERVNLETPCMSVIIQKFIEPDFAGIWIGKDYYGGYLEWVCGNGEKLVSGNLTPNKENWTDKSYPNNCIICNGGEIGRQLKKMQNSLSSYTPTADFEWCVINQELIMLQYRAVTKGVQSFNEDEIKAKLSDANSINDSCYFGLPVSPGIVEGSSIFVRKINEVKEWNEGDILMAWFTDPDWIELLSKASGLVTAVGSLLCHSAIIAREFGIPCVTGLGQNMKKIWKLDNIYINGNTGEVRPKTNNNM